MCQVPAARSVPYQHTGEWWGCQAVRHAHILSHTPNYHHQSPVAKHLLQQLKALFVKPGVKEVIDGKEYTWAQ